MYQSSALSAGDTLSNQAQTRVHRFNRCSLFSKYISGLSTLPTFFDTNMMQIDLGLLAALTIQRSSSIFCSR